MKAILISLLTFFPISVKAQSEVECMSSVIYHEANTESIQGKKAVMQVVLHRAKMYKKSICETIKMHKQFSWVGKKPFIPYNNRMQQMLEDVSNHPKVLNNEKFQYFFHKSLSPPWAEKMHCMIIDSHKYCMAKGASV